MAVLARRTRLAVSAALLIAALSADSSLARAESLEDAVKATYIYKFAPFVTWPPQAQGDAFSICVSGTDEIANLLPPATAGQDVDGRRIAVRTISGTDIPADCRILYVAASPAEEAVLGAAHGRPVLTITNESGLGHGIVRLIVIDHHVRFDVDTKLAADAGLPISSKLLVLAHAVTPQGRE